MKTITMDYEMYQDEIQQEYETGKMMGLSNVMRYLESGKPYLEFESRKPENVSEVWMRILKALGRDDELNP